MPDQEDKPYRLWWMAAIYHPTEKEREAGKVVSCNGPTATLARTEEEVHQQAGRWVPVEWVQGPGRLEVLVRPF